MAIKIDCPRCKQNLLVPEKKAGQYAVCPRCGGRFWVPNAGAGELAPPEPAAAGGPAAARTLQGAVVAALPPQAPSAPPVYSAAGVATSHLAIPTPPAPQPTTALPRSDAPAVAPSPGPVDRQRPAVVPLPPAPVKAGRKVARLISAETAQSVLQPAADGKLPDLRLQEAGEGRPAEAKSRSVNPLLLYGALTLSAVMSLVLVLMDLGSPGQETSTEKDRARQQIELKFFGGGADPADLKPFQKYLRDAKQAHTDHNGKAEHDCYEKVLQMLRAERGPEERPLTGNPETDKELESRIETILQGT